MKQEIKQKYDQVEVIYIAGVLTVLSYNWKLSKRYIRETLIEKNKLSESQEKELIKILDIQIKFQEQVKNIEKKHFEKLCM